MGPFPIWSRIAATASGSGRDRPGLDLERGPHARHQGLVHHRVAAPGRLGAGQELPAPEQLLPRARQRVVQRPLGREDVHEAQVQPVHRHRPGHRLERVQPAELAEPPAGVARLLQQRQRQTAGGAQVPPPLLRHPLEEGRLVQHVHAPDPEDLVQVAEGDRRVELGTADRGTDAGVGDFEARPVLRSQISGLRHRRNRHRGQVGNQLGELEPDRVHHHRIGGADQGAPRLLFPELKIFRGNEFVANDAPGDGPEAGGVARVDHLLRRGRIEVRHRLRAQDQHAVALGGDGKSPPNLAVYLDGPVGTGRQTLAAADARIVVDLKQQRLFRRHRDGVGRTDANASQACDA